MALKPEILAALKWLRSVGGRCRDTSIPEEHRTAFPTAIAMGLICVSYPHGIITLGQPRRHKRQIVHGNNQPQKNQTQPKKQARLLRQSASGNRSIQF